MTYEHIIFEEADGVATLVLNRPTALNALHAEMIAEMNDVFERLSKTTSARALLISGAGRGFCSGIDMRHGSGLANTAEGLDTGAVLEQQLNPLAENMAALPIPIIAATHGPVAGAGCAIVLCADFVIAAPSAFFMLAFTNVGLIPDTGVTWTLPRIIGRARAIEMIFLAERISAEQALEWGMIYRVIAAEEDLMRDAHALAARLAQRPTRALGLARRALHEGASQTLAESLRLERVLQREAGFSEDYAEGVAAFREKRSPRFQGK